MMTELRLEPRQEQRYLPHWDQRCGDGRPAAEGRYRARGLLPVDPELAAELSFSIEARTAAGSQAGVR